MDKHPALGVRSWNRLEESALLPSRHARAGLATARSDVDGRGRRDDGSCSSTMCTVSRVSRRSARPHMPEHGQQGLRLEPQASKIRGNILECPGLVRRTNGGIPSGETLDHVCAIPNLPVVHQTRARRATGESSNECYRPRAMACRPTS